MQLFSKLTIANLLKKVSQEVDPLLAKATLNNAAATAAKLNKVSESFLSKYLPQYKWVGKGRSLALLHGRTGGGMKLSDKAGYETWTFEEIIKTAYSNAKDKSLFDKLNSDGVMNLIDFDSLKDDIKETIAKALKGHEEDGWYVFGDPDSAAEGLKILGNALSKVHKIEHDKGATYTKDSRGTEITSHRFANETVAVWIAEFPKRPQTVLNPRIVEAGDVYDR